MRFAASSRRVTGRPCSNPTLSARAPAKSISPFMARAVMAAILSRKPRNSASSSSISFSIMVDSISATSSFLRRRSPGTKTASMAVIVTGSARPSNGNSQAISGASHCGVPTAAPCARRTSAAFLTAPSFNAGCAALEIRTRTFFTPVLIAHLPSQAKPCHFAGMAPEMAPELAQGRVLVVTGPTASGKSALALALAERRYGTVINADAMQTYDAFPILTAQPTAPERARVPHALYGILPLSETLSAARWRSLAAAEIERCLAAHRLPILCGGSGLYLRTLMDGIAAIPDAPAALREQANAEWKAMGADAFRARLAEKDPAIVARLKHGDRQRHVRAWEVWLATGRPLSIWQAVAGERAAERAPERAPARAPWRFTIVLLSPERRWLRERIAARFDA